MTATRNATRRRSGAAATLPLALALALAFALGGCARDDAPRAVAIAPHCDLPLGRISCDSLPMTAPLPADMADDERTHPYHVLVRVFCFPSLAPLDVDPAEVMVRGGGPARRVAPGEYRIDSLASGFVVAGVYRRLEAGAAPSIQLPQGAPMGERAEALAVRNPLILARHALTVCDLYVSRDQELDVPADVRGLVVDRETGEPIAGATVACATSIVTATTAADGTFRFDPPLRWSDWLAGTKIERDGWQPTGMNARMLLSMWVDRLKLDRTAAFVMTRTKEGAKDGAPRRTLLPPLPK